MALARLSHFSFATKNSCFAQLVSNQTKLNAHFIEESFNDADSINTLNW